MWCGAKIQNYISHIILESSFNEAFIDKYHLFSKLPQMGVITTPCYHDIDTHKVVLFTMV